MIQINGTIKLGQSIDAATRKAMVEMVRASRAEDGCLDYSFASDLADPDTLVLGWLGSPTTEKYLQLITPVLQELCARHPEVILRIVGGGDFAAPGIPVEHVTWSLEDEARWVNSFDMQP